MCSVAPALVTRVEGNQAWIEGRPDRPISIIGLDSVRPGDYVIVHAGLAIQRLDPAEAAAALALFKELEQIEAGEPQR